MAIGKRIKKFKWHLSFIMIGISLLFIFYYIPILGYQIAFRDYEIYLGMWKSKWIWFDNFKFLGDRYFWVSVKNTIIISTYRMAVGFPIPIILALMLNEVKARKYKRLVQSVSYLPHFLSWIIVAYMMHMLLSLDTGAVNIILQKLGFKQIHFFGEAGYFRHIIIWSGVWKEMGWGTIIYLAALSNIDQEIYEAATVDGAGRFKRIYHINIPGIIPIISIMFILSIPGILSAGYDQIYPLVNPANLVVSNVLDVYIVRLGLTQAQYSISTAIGLMLSIMNLILVLSVNNILKRLGQQGLW